MHRGIDPIIKYIEDNASEVSHCLRGDKYGKGKKRKQTLWYWIAIGSIDGNSCFQSIEVDKEINIEVRACGC